MPTIPPVGSAPREQMGLAEQAAFLNSVLESSTEYSIVAKDLEGRILPWNEGARRIYGYEPTDVVGKSAFLLHDPADVKSGRAQEILDEARRSGKWSGALTRVRKIACSSASSARSLRSELDTRQPTIRRENTSITNAT